MLKYLAFLLLPVSMVAQTKIKPAKALDAYLNNGDKRFWQYRPIKKLSGITNLSAMAKNNMASSADHSGAKRNKL